MFRTALFLTAVALSCGVNAQPAECQSTSNRAGIFKNVSSSGQASAGKPVTACTIINSLESMDSTTVFFAEAPQGDAVLEVFYVAEPRYTNVMNGAYATNLFPKRVFDDYLSGISSAGVRLLESELRLPGKITDAAALLTSDLNYYTALAAATSQDRNFVVNSYHFGVCASGYPKTGESWVNVAITNLGPSKSNACYAKEGVLFEK